VAYSAEQVLLNKPQIYGDQAKLHWYPKSRFFFQKIESNRV